MKFFSTNHTLSAKEVYLIPEALYELMKARFKVSIFSAKKYLPVATKRQDISTHYSSDVTTIANVINGLSWRTPWSSTCLVKVLAASKMMAKRNLPHSFHLGVQKEISSHIKAHAWLSYNSKIIIGGDTSAEYTEISTIEL